MDPEKMAAAERQAAERRRKMQSGGVSSQAHAAGSAAAVARPQVRPSQQTSAPAPPRVSSTVVVPEGSQPGRTSSQTNVPSLFTSGIFSGGGFGEWMFKNAEAGTSTSFHDLMANFFAHGMAFGNEADFAAVRGLGTTERATFVMAAALQNMFAARLLFTAFEESFRSMNPTLARLIDERMPAVGVGQLGALTQERDEARRERDDALRVAKDAKAKLKELDSKLRRERDDHRSELQRRESDHQSEVAKLKEKICALENENHACYQSIAYEKFKAKDSVLHMLKKYKGFNDISGIDLEKDELPDDYPPMDPITPLHPQVGAGTSGRAEEATTAQAAGDEDADDNTPLAERVHHRGSKRRKEK